MADCPSVSVLPTTSWTDACTEVAAQLGDPDGLLLIHDVQNDPITEHQNTPEGVRLIAAGEPEHCSGKANATAAGIEAARHDRIVPIGGTIRETIERQVRWAQILRWHFPGVVVGTVLILLFVLASAIVAPLPTAVLLTVVHLAVNEILSVRWWTAVLVYPAVFMFVPLIVYALARRTFVWGGRRYH